VDGVRLRSFGCLLLDVGGKLPEQAQHRDADQGDGDDHFNQRDAGIARRLTATQAAPTVDENSCQIATHRASNIGGPAVSLMTNYGPSCVVITDYSDGRMSLLFRYVMSLRHGLIHV
jgi:hypothetical protein